MSVVWTSVTAMLANVYVDGFNLYYGIKRWPDSKWLDLGALCARLFPNDRINRIRYFTAHLKGQADESAPRRQQVYLRALAIDPRLSIHTGTFLVRRQWMPLAMPARRLVPVIRTEEKGSDVSLGAYLLFDACQGDYDMAVVKTNDSDLREPIAMVQGPPFELPVWVVNPHPRKAAALRPTTHLDLHRGDVIACQLPQTVRAANGKILTKPGGW